MYVLKKQFSDLTKQFNKELLGEIDMKSKFLFEILEEDDWSFVIKSHALIETLLTELIITKIEEPRMKHIVERLPLNDEKIGKIKIAKEYALLSDAQRHFIKKFSELRNSLVHKADNLDLKLDAFMNNLDPNQKKSWVNALTWFEHEPDYAGEKRWSEIAIKAPKIALWMAVFMLVALISLTVTLQKNTARLDAAEKETTKQILLELRHYIDV